MRTFISTFGFRTLSHAGSIMLTALLLLPGLGCGVTKPAGGGREGAGASSTFVSSTSGQRVFQGAVSGGNPVGDIDKALGLAAPLAATTGHRVLSVQELEKRDLGPDKNPTTLPQVWHRGAQQPTCARVYVGDGNSLELVGLQVSVTVEGPRARTVVDHIFHNPHDRQLEGTFEYPLPAGASPSYFAMFLGNTRVSIPPGFEQTKPGPLPAEAVNRLTPTELIKQVNSNDWGRLQEARVVARSKALETYEKTVRGRIDPGLLEYAGNNTFSGRVFPIPAKGYNRVIMAYEELLPHLQDQVLYRFPLPNGKLSELQFQLQAAAAECLQPTIQPGDVKKEEGGGRLVFSNTWKDQGPGGDIVFAFSPPRVQVQAVSGRQGDAGPLYLYARIRPDLPVQQEEPFSGQAIFLLDTSLSEHPDRFTVSMKLLRKILESDPDIKQFNVLTFNVGTAWVEPRGWINNTPVGIEQVMTRLDGLVLEGATDLSAALDRLVHPGFDMAAGLPVNVFLLSDGQITWGQAEAAILVAHFEASSPLITRFHCYRTGIGADNLELFEALTRKGGGIFNCFGDTDLEAASTAHRRHCLQVNQVSLTGGAGVSDLLVAGRRASIYPGGDLVLAAVVKEPGHLQAVVEGTFQGKKFTQEFPLDVTGTGELAPRGWGEIAVASLLAINDPRLDSLVTAYCQQFGVGCRVASFLVLENEADYKRLNLQEERGKVAPGGDLAHFLDDSWRQLTQGINPREYVKEFLSRVGPQLPGWGPGGSSPVNRLLGLLTDKDFETPDSPLSGGLLTRPDVSPTYLATRERDRTNIGNYLTEARRRADGGEVDGAVRVLSSVVEEFPGRTDALRLVGYRLVDLKQPAQAVRLFQQVQHSRPFEPHSYRDLALSLEQSGRFGMAALNYEVVLAGNWNNRFRESFKTVSQEEYAQMLRQSLRSGSLNKPLIQFFSERLAQLGSGQSASDLRVTISWNTDDTDVDLWIIEPDGTKCFYQRPHTPTGGELSQDQTQGYGPERYQVVRAQPGVYTIVVHYFRANPNLLGQETHVNVAVTRHSGTPQEEVERRTVILQHQDQQVSVCTVKF